MARFSVFRLLLLAPPVFAGAIDLAAGGITEWQYVGARVRHQNEYDAALFGAIESIRIQRIAFYSNGEPTPGTSTVSLSFSTIPSGSALSPMAEANIGADVVTAFSGAWSGTSPGEGFNMWLNLATPFVYEPRKGNLLIDLQNDGDSFLFPFGVGASKDLPSTHMLAGDTEVRAGDPFPAPGWIVRLEGTTTYRAMHLMSVSTPVSPTPEPGVAALVAAGLGLLGIARRARRR